MELLTAAVRAAPRAVNLVLKTADSKADKLAAQLGELKACLWAERTDAQWADLTGNLRAAGTAASKVFHWDAKKVDSTAGTWVL
jgi:hypothetical protein